MCGDMMPKEQYDFIKGIQDYMLEATNMEENEAWSFGFRIWQTRNWLRKYIAIEVSEDCISREYIKTLFENNLTGTCKDVVHTIANAPSVVPTGRKNRQVERAEGEWIGYEIPSECSVCGHHWDEYVSGQELWHDGSVPNYCPNCGAKMKG